MKILMVITVGMPVTAMKIYIWGVTVIIREMMRMRRADNGEVKDATRKNYDDIKTSIMKYIRSEEKWRT